MRKIDYSKLERIVILRLGKIGDLIISSFVFSVIKKINPSVELKLITLKKNEEVLRVNPDIDKLYFVKHNILSLSRLIPLKFKEGKIDLLIDLNDNPSSSSAFLLNFFNAKEKLGFSFDKQIKKLTIAIDPPSKEKTHLIERYAYLLKSSGLEISEENIKPVLYLDQQVTKSVSEELSFYKKNFKLVGLNLSAGSPIRKYPVKKWISIIESILRKYSFIRFIILNDRSEIKEARFIREKISPEFILNTSIGTFQHFAAKIKNLDLLITPDTSAVHICSAFKIPVIALYPNVIWNFISFAPYKTINRSIISESEEIKNIKESNVIEMFEDIVQELRWK